MTIADLYRIFEQSGNIDEIATLLSQQHRIALSGLKGSSIAFVAAQLSRKLSSPGLFIFPTENEAKQFYEDLCELGGEETIVYFPALNRRFWSEVGPSRIDVGRRIDALKKIRSRKAQLIITHAEAMIEKLADPEDVELYTLILAAGERIQFDHFLRQLVDMGFDREDRVDYPGEFSVRGGIIDVYLFEEDQPARIEFFGDEIESIRLFDVETQRSITAVEQLTILPLYCAGPYGSLSEMAQAEIQLQATLFDYLAPETTLWITNESLVHKTISDHLSFNRFSDKSTHLTTETFYFSDQAVNAKWSQFRQVTVNSFHSDQRPTISFNIKQNNHFAGNLALFRSEVDTIHQQIPDAAIVMACDSEGQRDRLRELFLQEDFPHHIHISTLNLSNGFSWPEEKLFIYTSRELYSRVRMPKLDKLVKRPVSFREQSSMHRGDYVVHTDYGIGIFQGLEKIRAYGKLRECLTIEYLDGDKVYVPLEKMDQVQKYSAADEGVPSLNKLGNINWEKLKERTTQRMKEIAGELINLYAARRSQEGFPFAEDTVWQNELEASFQFEETIDQLSAIRDVKADLEASRPMDRLVCGDVGYGKTEVAVRAAFKVVTEGKQVAVLVPTTILAQQHWMTFSERMKNFPVRIEMISRFKSPKEQKEILEKLKDGKIDLIIGTHRLLSKDVKFKDIGLLIVDEEQRFGVMHKENIKLIKNSVDTLTLSATPIPRTMHMALMGAKDMSIINSPPNNRHPIKTEVSRFDRDLIREAILKEIDRGGQVFFVHNRVQSIYGMASLVRDIVPEASIAVAHGQMKGHELEKVMLKFIQGQVQVLVCTMIIENGIDMPHANTLIINRADKFGLAQLYQLRGRVGRSDQQAYAYLIIPPLRRLSHDAIRRLQTIQENSELGAGYKIAMRDLEIRGSGNIFGAEQTGFVNALGFELYTRIIREAIREIRKEKNLDVDEVEEEPSIDAKVECAVDAYLPEEYISSTAERVDIYRRLVQAAKASQIQSLQKELVDRFGELPEKAQNLFDYMLIKILASKAKMSKLVLKDHHLTGEFDYQQLPNGDEFKSWLHKLVQAGPKELALRHENEQLVFELLLTHGHSLLKEAKNILQRLI